MQVYLCHNKFYKRNLQSEKPVLKYLVSPSDITTHRCSIIPPIKLTKTE